MKVYISGPMTGLPRYNFGAFDAATEKLRALGHEVLSPAEHDRELGIDPDRPDTYNISMLSELGKWDMEAVQEVDVLYMLKGWEKSSGGMAEHRVAVWLGKEIYYESAFPGIDG